MMIAIAFAILCYDRPMERADGPGAPTRKDVKRAESAFLRAQNAEARCLIGPHPECHGEIIEAHSVQRAKLILIADKRRRLQILSIDMLKEFDMVRAKENERAKIFCQYRSISNPIITGKWSCRHHDNSTFSQIEKGNIDSSNEEHCLLLAYRAVLFDYFKKCVSLRFFEELAREFQTTVFSPKISICSERKVLAQKFKNQIEKALYLVRDGRESGMDHRMITVLGNPKIAATGVTYREGGNIGTRRELREIKKEGIMQSSFEQPMFVTVYPERDRNVAILSFPKGWDSARVYIPAFWEEDTHLASALLSKTILDETEGIMISPAQWRSYGEKKRNRILDQFVVTNQPDPMLIETRADDPEIPEEVLSALLYRRDPDFVDNSDPEEFNLFSD